MKIAGWLWWRFDERLRDAGGIARESKRWAMDGWPKMFQWWM